MLLMLALADIYLCGRDGAIILYKRLYFVACYVNGLNYMC